MTIVSSIGLQILMNANLQQEQTTLGTLSEQLASGKQHADLTDYTPVQARQLLDFQNAIVQKNSYIASMQTVQTRLSDYDATMSDIENIATQANSLATQNQALDPSKVGALQAQVKAYLQQTADDLNQKIGDRYIYAGVRYATQPVGDLTSLGPPSASTVASPVLPDYDTEAIAGTPQDANAYTQDTTLVDTGFSVTYGISSNDPAFQKMISGLRFMYAATQSNNPATYQADMQQGSTLLGAAIPAIQALHTTNANNQNLLTQQTTTLNNNINSLKDQVNNIQQVDLTQVGTEINLLQTQLQASYSATASLEQLSIVKYL